MHVIGGKINTLQTEVDELRDSQYSHADALQRRSALLTVVYIQVRLRDLTIQPCRCITAQVCSTLNCSYIVAK